eukprot:3442908-Rhodomonas_salina.7
MAETIGLEMYAAPRDLRTWTVTTATSTNAATMVDVTRSKRRLAPSCFKSPSMLCARHKQPESSVSMAG